MFSVKWRTLPHQHIICETNVFQIFLFGTVMSDYLHFPECSATRLYEGCACYLYRLPVCYMSFIAL